MKLGIIVASTRPTRIGHLIGQWVNERAVEHGKFDIEMLDLAPAYPRAGRHSDIDRLA